jgi:hypothetical protein
MCVVLASVAYLACARYVYAVAPLSPPPFYLAGAFGEILAAVDLTTQDQTAIKVRVHKPPLNACHSPCHCWLQAQRWESKKAVLKLEVSCICSACKHGSPFCAGLCVEAHAGLSSSAELFSEPILRGLSPRSARTRFVFSMEQDISPLDSAASARGIANALKGQAAANFCRLKKLAIATNARGYPYRLSLRRCGGGHTGGGRVVSDGDCSRP